MRPASPEQAADILRTFMDVGVQGFTFNNPNLSTPELLEAAGRGQEDARLSGRIDSNQQRNVTMRVFVTGTTGFIGTTVVRELLEAGHQVVGLARSDTAAAAVTAAGAEVHHGALDDLDSLRSGAVAADGVIHLAYVHDFSDIVATGLTDLRAVEAIGAALDGSGKPFAVTSRNPGSPAGAPGNGGGGTRPGDAPDRLGERDDCAG